MGRDFLNWERGIFLEGAKKKYGGKNAMIVWLIWRNRAHNGIYFQ